MKLLLSLVFLFIIPLHAQRSAKPYVITSPYVKEAIKTGDGKAFLVTGTNPNKTLMGDMKFGDLHKNKPKVIYVGLIRPNKKNKTFGFDLISFADLKKAGYKESADKHPQLTLKYTTEKGQEKTAITKLSTQC